MPIQLTLTSEEFAALDETAQADYETVGDVIQLAGLSTWGESNAAIGGLKSALKKERENAAEAAKQAAQLKHSLKGATAEELAAAQARATEIESNAAKELGALKQQLREAKTERVISDAILQHRGTEPLRAVLQTHVKVDETGEAYVPGQGDARLTVNDYTAQLKTDPVYHSVFQGSGHSGGSTPPGSAAGGADPAPHHSSRSEMNATDKAAYISQHGIDKFMAIPA